MAFDILSHWRKQYYLKNMVDIRIEEHNKKQLELAGKKFVESIKK